MTLIADTELIVRGDHGSVAAPYSIRASTVDDVGQIGSLYFGSYEEGQGCATEAEAIADIAASFAGGYGEYLHSASPVAVIGSAIVAAAMTVERAIWDDTPACPFLIELFTHRDHRRRGLGTALLRVAAAEISQTAPQIALRVEEQNDSAIALYRNLGFRHWEVPGRP